MSTISSCLATIHFMTCIWSSPKIASTWSPPRLETEGSKYVYEKNSQHTYKIKSSSPPWRHSTKINRYGFHPPNRWDDWFNFCNLRALFNLFLSNSLNVTHKLINLIIQSFLGFLLELFELCLVVDIIGHSNGWWDWKSVCNNML